MTIANALDPTRRYSFCGRTIFESPTRRPPATPPHPPLHQRRPPRDAVAPPPPVQLLRRDDLRVADAAAADHDLVALVERGQDLLELLHRRLVVGVDAADEPALGLSPAVATPRARA